MKYCCITGHRVTMPEKKGFIEQELRKEIEEAINDGYRLFISGFADGTDLLFARLIVEYREKYPDLYLEAALPYPQNRRSAEFKNLLEKCNGIMPCSHSYSPDCFMKRNMYMVDQSDRIIAVYDGRKRGGTVNTILYARINNKDIRIIEI